MTICPVYEGSVKISWYPVIAVLKTTSPERSAGAPKLRPSKTVPSSRARIAESNNFLLGIGVKTIVRYLAWRIVGQKKRHRMQIAPGAAKCSVIGQVYLYGPKTAMNASVTVVIAELPLGLLRSLKNGTLDISR